MPLDPELEAAIRASFEGGRSAAPLLPEVPVQEQPDLREAQREFERAATESFELAEPGMEGQVKAVEAREAIRDRPAPIPSGEPVAAPPGSFRALLPAAAQEIIQTAEEGSAALLPRVQRRDERPLSAFERAKTFATTVSTPEVALDALLPAAEIVPALLDTPQREAVTERMMSVLPGPVQSFFRQMQESTEGLNPGALKQRATRSIRRMSPIAPPEEEGVPLESPSLAALRVLGTAAPAVVTETAERIPVPDASAILGGVLTNDAELANIGLTTPSTLGEELGLKPATRQKVRRENPIADWMQGIFERIEEGRGLEADFEDGYADILGEDWRNTGWAIGLGVDLLTPWEGLLLKPAAGVARTAATAKRLSALAPPDVPVKRSPLLAAIEGAETEFGDHVAEAFVRELEAGRVGIDDAPPALRARIDEVAMRETGFTGGELARLEGVGRAPDEVVDIPRSRLEEGFEEAREATRRPRTEALDAAADEGVVARPGEEPGVFAERRQRIEASGRQIPKRERLPVFTRGAKPVAVTDEADFFREVARVYEDPEAPKLGYNIPPGEGFRRMVDAADQAPQDLAYELRNIRGDLIGDPVSLDRAADMMMHRQLDGDVIWRGAQRRVASWGARGKPVLTPNFFFSSPAEEAAIKQLRRAVDQGGDVRARPKRLQQLRDQARAQAESVDPGRQTVGQAIADAMTQAPDATLGQLPTTSRFADVVREASRLVLRDSLDSTKLVPMPDGAMVTRADRARILSDVDRMLGLDPKQALKAIQGGGRVPKRVDRALQTLLPQRAPGSPLTPDDWISARRAAAKKAGGVLADKRYRVSGVEPLRKRMMDALKDFRTDRRKVSKLQEDMVRNSTMGRIVSLFTEDVAARLPTDLRTRLKQLRVGVERNADDVMKRVEQIVRDGSDKDAAVIDIIGDLNPVHPSELRLADEVVSKATTNGRFSPADLGELRRQWRGPRPGWLDNEDDFISSFGMRRWARETQAQAAAVGKQWAEANLTAAGRKVAQTTIGEAIDTIPLEDAVELFRELSRGVTADGPVLERVLSDIGFPVDTRPKEALVQMALGSGMRSQLADAVQELLGEGLLVRSSDPRTSKGGVLTAVLEGNHRTWNKQLGRWEHHYTDNQLQWAESQLRNWGIEPGAGSVIRTERIGGVEVKVPEFLREELASLRRSGVVSSRDLSSSQAYNKLLRFFKESTTHGIGVPNPAYFMGQWLGIMPTLVTTRGLGGAASTLGTLLFERPALVGELSKRLGGVGMPTAMPLHPDGSLLRTASGDIIDIDALEAAARRAGLDETRADFEVASQLHDVLRRAEPSGILDWRQLPKGARWWQEQIRRVGGAADLNVRLASFIDDARRGVPLDQAALRSREAVLDFRDLTRFESRIMRNIVTFYAFMRKNSDALVKALIMNPERVLGQMRLAEASLTTSGLTGVQLGSLRPQDLGRMTVFQDEEVISEGGRPHPLYAMNRINSTPVGVPEALGHLAMLMTPFAAVVPGRAGDKLRAASDPEGLLQQINPIGQTIAILLQGRKLDREFDSPWSNRIPPVLLEAPGLRDFLMDGLAVGPMELRATDDPLTADEDATAANGGIPSVWAAGEAKVPGMTDAQRQAHRTVWQLLSTWLGRPIQNMQQAAEAGLVPGADVTVPPNVTQNEATWQYLLGLRARPVLTEREATRRSLFERESRFIDEAGALRPPPDVGLQRPR